MKLITPFDVFLAVEGSPIEPRVIDDYDELFNHILSAYIDAALTSDKSYTKPRLLKSLERLKQEIEETIDIIKE